MAGRPPSRRGFLAGATMLAAIIAMGVGISVAVVPAGDAGASVLSKDDDAVSLASAEPSKIALLRTSTDPGGVRLELHVINANGSGSWSLVAAGSSSTAAAPYELGQRPAWSPDGRKIAFAGMDDDGNTDVYVVGADGRGQQRLTRHAGVDGNPAWSPDGRKIAFTRGVGRCCAETYIYVMSADGSGKRRLARGHVHFSVAWSPDGRKMLFERPNPRHPAPPVPGDFAEDLYVMNADGSGQRNLTRNPASDMDPDWSPDGRRIVFDRERGFRNQRWLMNPDGSGQRSLTPAAGWRSGDPDWSPDGRKIAFGGRAPTSPPDGGIFVSNADGSERRRLTQRGESPAWSPDGRKIAFGERDGGIYVMNADGSERRRLTQRGGDREGSPAWSPDGKMIAFGHGIRRAAALYVMTADGRGERMLIRTDGGVLGVLHQAAIPWAWSSTRP